MADDKPDWRNDVCEKDRPIVDQIKERMKKDGITIPNENLNNDNYIARFVRARVHKVDDAYEMLKNCLKWREEKKVDTIDDWWATTEMAKRIISYYPAQTFWEGKEGRPVCLDHYTLTDPAAMYAVFPVEELVHYHVYVMEQVLKDLAKASTKANKPITDAIFIFNMGGLGMKHMGSTTISLAKPTFQTDADYYPECVAAAIVINAPKLFSVLYRLVSPFVDPRTLEKIMGNDWKDGVHEWAPDDALPEFWGGTSSDKWLHPAGSIIPGASGGSAEQKVDLNVAAGTSEQIEVEVNKEGSSITWEFKTVSYDIDFMVDGSLKGKKKKGKEEGEKIVVEEKTRVQSHQEMIVGSHEQAKVGTYRLVFDNTFSWTTAKQVELTYGVHPPMTKADIKRETKKQKEDKKKKKKGET